jgi:hypothetical protein
VLREVNGRAFCAELGQTLPEAVFARDLNAALDVLAFDPPLGIAHHWRAKRAYGMAGRGHRVIAPRAAKDADVAFLQAGMREGGVQIEPQVKIVRELGIHGVVEADGSLELGQLVEQECDEHGQWLATRIAKSDREVTAAFVNQGRRVSWALHRAGYFGPFGVDGFLYSYLRDGEEEDVRLQPRSEVNARYSMGFTVGFRR